VVPEFRSQQEDGFTVVPRPAPKASASIKAVQRRPIRGRCNCSWLTAAEVMEGLNDTWSVSRFGSVHPPLVVATLDPEHDADTREALDRSDMLPIQRVLDMPIKFPGSPEYRLPAELEALVPLVRKVRQRWRGKG